MTETPVPSFNELGLSEPILQALTAVGYESPSPIQAQTIPVLLGGSDVLGQAQTGTGKTAAFALPLLVKIELDERAPQALVLVPTRELAIQVAEAFQKYAAQLPDFHVLPIYGGQSYTPQLKGLKRGAHVIVGTPGRVMDHIKSGALDISTLRFVVLDEGDEMLQMGFIDDIEWILEQTPPERQIALFSATMPPQIRRVAQKHMRNPQQITIQTRTATAPKIRQRMWFVSGMHKLDALTRMLEVEKFDALLIFVRTKIETADLADRLQARGFSAAALNGDIPQQQREKTVARLKNGQLDIVVATDVAARGLDVERISHVVNYDIPYDAETYVHRIGRTGRAGRSGEAILFVAPRERNMLRIIERVTRSRIEPMTLPSVSDVNEHRVLKFKERVTAAVQAGEGKVFQELLEQMEREQNIPAIEIAAALAGLLQGDTPFLLAGRDREDSPRRGAWPDSYGEAAPARSERARSASPAARPASPAARPARVAGSGAAAANETVVAAGGAGSSAPGHEAGSEQLPSSRREGVPSSHSEADSSSHLEAGSTSHPETAPSSPRASDDEFLSTDDGETPGELSGAADDSSIEDATTSNESPAAEATSHDEESPRRRERHERSREEGSGDNAVPMETFRLEVGHVHGVLPGNIVGAIANEAGLDGKHIGHIDIREDHSFVDLPAGMPKEIFRELKKVKIRGEELRISRVDSKPPRPERSGFRPRREEGDREFRPRRSFGGDREFAPRRGPGGDRAFGPRRDAGGESGAAHSGEFAGREGFAPRGEESSGGHAGDAPRREFRPRREGSEGFRSRPPGDRPFRPREPGGFAPRGRSFGGGDRPRESSDRPREFRPRSESGEGFKPREFRPRNEAGEGFKPREFRPRGEGSGGFRPREAGDRPTRPRAPGEFAPRERTFGSGDRPAESSDRPREFRPGRPHGIRAGKPENRGFSKGPPRGKGPRKPFTPR